MNAERLHALIARINEELTITEAIDNLESISAALQLVVNQPNAQSQQTLGSSVVAFRDSMANSQLLRWTPAWLQLLTEVGFRDLLGEPLLVRVDRILTRNEITPALAKEEIENITGLLSSLQEAVTQLGEAFGTLNINAELLEPGECEIGLLIPRSAVENDLSALAQELKEFDMIVRTVREVATGEIASVKVRTISSSDFLIFLAEHSAEAALMAVILERLVAGYKTILEIRKLHGELQQHMGKSVKEVEKFAETQMAEKIKAIGDDAIKMYPKKDTGRKHELRTALDVILRKLADRIDRGFQIDIRIQPLPEPPNAGDGKKEKPDPKLQAHLKHRKTIEDASRQLEFFRHEGPPILNLEDKGTNGHKNS